MLRQLHPAPIPSTHPALTSRLPARHKTKSNSRPPPPYFDNCRAPQLVIVTLFAQCVSLRACLCASVLPLSIIPSCRSDQIRRCVKHPRRECHLINITEPSVRHRVVCFAAFQFNCRSSFRLRKASFFFLLQQATASPDI